MKVHYDPHDLDDYPHSHPDAASVGDEHMGDTCPRCGVPLSMLETVVLITGEKGTFADVDDMNDPTPAFHPPCWEERTAEVNRIENETLADYATNE